MKSFFTKATALLTICSIIFIFSSCGYDIAGSIAALPPAVDPAKPAFILSDISTLDRSTLIPLTSEELAGQTAEDGDAFGKDAQGNILITAADGTFAMQYRYGEAGDGWCMARYDKNSMLTKYMWTDNNGIYHDFTCENGGPVRSTCSLTGSTGTAKAFYSQQGSLLGIMAGSGEIGWYDVEGKKLGQENVSAIQAEFFG